MNRPRLVVTVTGATSKDMRERRDEAARLADIVELRLDSMTVPDVAAVLAHRTVPVIVTCRPAWEGGAFRGAEEERLALLEEGARLGAEYVDVEWQAHAPRLVARRQGIVVSNHDFEGVPADLADRYTAMRATGAEVVKIAVSARRLDDCLPLLSLADEARQHASVLIAMGTPGMASRVLAERFGSCWSYAGEGVAPGQLPAARLLHEFRFRSLTRSTAVFGVAGRPVDHSLSPVMHNAAFEAAGLNAVYLPIEAADADDFLALAGSLPLDGASVTAPLKVDVLRGLREADELVEQVGAVNTLKRIPGGWSGRNTDVAGFLAPLAGRPLRGARASVLGAGGAARAVSVALRSVGADVTVHARSRERGEALASQVSATVGAERPATGEWDLLVNATPVGTWPHVDESPLDGFEFPAQGLVYDLVYNPPETRLLRDARAAGCETIGGLEMLVAQAAAQFEWWTGVPAPRAVMEQAAKARLMEMAGTR